MPTNITFDYTRKYTNAPVQEIIQRSAATINVLEQLGAPYQNLPGYAKAQYQTEADALEAKQSALNALLQQIEPLLQEIDRLAGPLDKKNQGALSTLQGLLKTDVQKQLLGQIPR